MLARASSRTDRAHHSHHGLTPAVLTGVFVHLLSVFSLRNRALIALVTIVVGLFGGLALTTLKQELIPTISASQIVIVTQYPGAAPEIVEQDVSTPIETAIQGVAGLDASTARLIERLRA